MSYIAVRSIAHCTTVIMSACHNWCSVSDLVVFQLTAVKNSDILLLAWCCWMYVQISVTAASLPLSTTTCHLITPAATCSPMQTAIPRCRICCRQVPRSRHRRCSRRSILHRRSSVKWRQTVTWPLLLHSISRLPPSLVNRGRISRH